MSRDKARRPASSRTPVSRPRRIAGRAEPPPVEPVETTAAVTGSQAVESPSRTEPGGFDTDFETPLVPRGSSIQVAPLAAQPPDEKQRTDIGSLFASRRTTRVLVAVTAVLAVVAAGLGIWLWQHDEAGAAQPPPEGQIAVPEGRPVLLSADDAQQAVAAAAEAATTIVSTSHENYDEQVDEAARLMTEKFAAEYRQTAEDVRKDIVDTKTEVQVRIVAQGVVRANTSEVQALLFLNQYSTKDGGKTTYTPYRALVTVVHTDRGWLVSNLDTK